MGEAKRRKQTDRFYGKVPKVGKGILLAPPMSIAPDGKFTLIAGCDPSELRRAVLFWDRIRRPGTKLISFAPSPDEEFLASCGVIERHEDLSVPAGITGKALAQSYIRAFTELEAAEPGLWAMSEVPNSFLLEQGETFRPGRGALMELHRAIPLPAEDVPLADLLEFKEKRKDEIRDLTLELDGLFSRIEQAGDVNFELRRAINEVDKKCASILAVGKESNVKFILGDLSFGISLEDSFGRLIGASGIGEVIGQSFGLPTVGALLGMASQLKLKADLGAKIARNKKAEKIALSPYRVVSRLVNEPI